MSATSPNTGPIGPEPAGATPLDEEDLEGLIPSFVATRADLNRVELESITGSLPRLLTLARTGGPHAVLDYGFLLNLHRRMFSDVWRWAGTLRRRETNIGVDPGQIAPRSIQAIDDARWWHDHDVYTRDERAVRLHAVLVDIHPFPNGNGRATRLLADLYLTSIDKPMFSWGGATVDEDGSTRRCYLEALLLALSTGDHEALTAFAREH